MSAVLPLLHLIQHDILNEDDSDTELTCNQGRSWVFIDGGAYYKLLTIT